MLLTIAVVALIIVELTQAYNNAVVVRRNYKEYDARIDAHKRDVLSMQMENSRLRADLMRMEKSPAWKEGLDAGFILTAQGIKLLPTGWRKMSEQWESVPLPLPSDEREK